MSDVQPGTSSPTMKDTAAPTRKRKGHSLVLHLLLGIFCLWANVFYISASPNHYWHA